MRHYKNKNNNGTEKITRYIIKGERFDRFFDPLQRNKFEINEYNINYNIKN